MRQGDPQAYGELGLADLFELREECLRECQFRDIYRRHRLQSPSSPTHAQRKHAPAGLFCSDGIVKTTQHSIDAAVSVVSDGEVAPSQN